MSGEKIQVKVKLYAFLREIFGKREVTLSLDLNATPFDVILRLDELSNGKIAKIVLDNENKLRESYVILVNGRKIERKDIDSFVLDDGDELVIFPPTSGGLLL